MNRTIDSSAQIPSETTTPNPVLPVPLPVPRELDEVVRAIRADCLLAPDEYLEEVLVPFGGE
jgi:hypothetical protein